MRFLLCWLALGVLVSAADKPNVLFLLSDDHSYPYLSCYGDANVRTPVLDKLAGEGIKFRRFFTSAPQCVPSRAAYLSGRSPVAARITRFSSPLPRDVVTFPEVLKQEAGYYVGVVGRSYHLDGSGKGDEGLGKFLADGGYKTFPERFDVVQGGSDKEAVEQSAAFLEGRPKDKPFCLWVNFSDPHHAWTAPVSYRPDPASLKLPAHVPDLPAVREQYADYCAEVNRVDETVGKVLALLDRLGLAKDTLVVFAGDNGQALPHGKGSLYDPGCNVPFVVRWPGVVKAGSETDALAANIDVVPTLLAATEAPAPKNEIDGVSFLSVLKSGQPTSRDSFAYYYGDRLEAVRKGKWKLHLPHAYRSYVDMIPAELDGYPAKTHQRQIGFSLYDLEKDPGEKEDLAADQPELVKELQALAESERKRLDAGKRPVGRL